ncbi:MAG: hypothetical protein AB7P99_04615 [Vicinamibacterales bacterium]
MHKLLIVSLLVTCAACGRNEPAPAENAGDASPAVANCAPEGGLNFVCGMQNPEDLVLIPGTRWLLASGMAAGSGLNAIDTQARSAQSLFASGLTAAADARYAACPGPLDPQVANLHGLSLRSAGDSRYTLYATNHGGRESIEVFTIDAQGDAPAATWIGCVPMPDGLAANSVAAFTDGAIVATVLTMPGRTFEDLFAQRPTGAVFLWEPGSQGFRQLPGTELAGNNGIETSPNDQEFFVAASGSKQIVAFSRRDPSTPLRTAQLSEFAPDNVRFIDGNQLITAGMLDDEPECGGAPKTPEGIQCSRGYVVDVIDPQTMVVTELARGPRTPAFSGHAIAIPVGNELWLSSFNADRVAYRSLR